MKRMAWIMFLGAALTAGSLQAQGGTAIARLKGFEEVPAISSPGAGNFHATISEDQTQIDWEFDYFNIPNNVTQAHLHFAQKGVNGGIMVFMCSNLGNGPVGTPACPPSPGFLSGTFTAANVGSGANAQGIGPGAFGPLLRALRAGIVYANLHSDKYPGGEIRGQVVFTSTP